MKNGVLYNLNLSIKKHIYRIIKKILSNSNFVMMKNSTYFELTRAAHRSKFVELLNAVPKSHRNRLLELYPKTFSQNYQDLFALSSNHFKRNGFFVEFGATNGVNISNTYLLEKEFKWSGILVEPAISWHQELKMNLTCTIDTNCVWSASEEDISFCETNEKEYSTIKNFFSADLHHEKRSNYSEYIVKSISLLDLLKKYDAPRIIDYISIDTEGSEYEILKNFDFKEYQFRSITCEHNFTENRNAIFNLLTSFGYRRVNYDIKSYEDWYIRH